MDRGTGFLTIALAVLLPLGAFRVESRSTATVVGTVFDSTAGRQLAGAQVQFTRTDGESRGSAAGATTDSLGRFEISGLVPATYLAGYTHAKLDSVGLEPEPVRIELLNATQRIDFGIPSGRSLRRSICQPSANDTATLVIVGRVRDSDAGSALSHVVVELWRDDGSGGRIGTRLGRASASDDGWFALCGVSSDVPMLVRAASEKDTSGLLPVVGAAQQLLHLPVTLGRGWKSVTPQPSPTGEVSLQERTWKGPATLRGQVKGNSGQPLVNARVAVRGTGQSTTTSSSGSFQFTNLPAGSQVLDVRGIGQEPLTQIVHLTGLHVNSVSVELVKRPVILAGVEITSARVLTRYERFEQRRRTSASGYFVRPDEVAAMPREHSMAKIVAGLPGVSVSCIGAYSCGVAMRRPSSHLSPRATEQCIPSLYIDGILDRVGDFNLLPAKDILAVEVYTREIGRPPEFTDLHRNCGAIVYWTKRR